MAMKLSPALPPPQEFMLGLSGCVPMGLAFDVESVPSPNSRGSNSSMSLESDGRSSVTCGVLSPPAEEQCAASVMDGSSCASPKGVTPPPAPFYPAPVVTVPGLPPAPTLPPGIPEPPSAPPHIAGSASSQVPPPWPAIAPAPFTPHHVPTGMDMPALLASSAPVDPTQPVSGLTCGSCMLGQPRFDAAMRAAPILSHSPTLSHFPQHPSPGLLEVPPLPAATVRMPMLNETEETLNSVLSLLNLLRSGPSVPPLPPSGCYGGLRVSSAISEGLGATAGAAAEAAARELGDRPVKVLLPWYPAHPSVGLFDYTKPAKVPVPSDEDSHESNRPRFRTC